MGKKLLAKGKELIAAEKAKMDEESKSAIGDRIKPLPSTEGMDDEQLRQLARELHAAIDKADEQRYDACYKVDKAKKETDELRNKHKELKCKKLRSCQVTLHHNNSINTHNGLSE